VERTVGLDLLGNFLGKILVTDWRSCELLVAVGCKERGRTYWSCRGPAAEGCLAHQPTSGGGSCAETGLGGCEETRLEEGRQGARGLQRLAS
jgi:hypothetical protein